jgi:flavin-dependent dehydrogenase
MPRPEHDVVIVGGGPAGLSTALFLAHHQPSLRDRIVVLERETYPREKFCAGGIGGRADVALARIGVHVDVPSVPVAGISVRLPQGDCVARAGLIGRVVRRIEYDHALALEARRRGIEVREGVRVQGVRVQEGEARVATDQGELRARAVVGADGVGSVVRRAMGLGQGRWKAQVLEVDTAKAEGDLPRDLLHFDLADRSFDGYAWDFPTIVGGEELMCRGIYHLVAPGKRASDEDITARLAVRLAAMGLDLGACKKKRYAERGFDPHEPTSWPGVLLVGEAAGIDPITGEGIAQAILYGEAAGPYLAAKLDRGDLSFADWPRQLRSRLLGVDYLTRTFICERFFGPARDVYEEWFHETPEMLPLGLDFFAGRPTRPAQALRVGLSVAQKAWQHRARTPFTAPARPAI